MRLILGVPQQRYKKQRASTIYIESRFPNSRDALRVLMKTPKHCVVYITKRVKTLHKWGKFWVVAQIPFG